MRIISMVKIGWGATLLIFLGLYAELIKADTFLLDGAFDSVTVYAGQGADHNLPELPGRIITGNIDWDNTHFTAIGLGKVRGTLGQSIGLFQGTPFEAVRHGYEVLLVKHTGLQSNAEVGAAYMLRTADLDLGVLGVNFGAGTGFSYALGDPSYEDGADDDPERRYHLQLLALFDFEWHLTGFDKFSVLTRIHHRSGVYGLVAPRHVGSNFLAIGVQYKF